MSSRFTASLFATLLTATTFVACAKSETPPVDDSAIAATPEARSPSGTAFYPREIPAERRAKLDADLVAAQRAYAAAPDNADSIIWVGRRLGYLERFQDAIRAFTEGIAKHPDDARLYRFRGHRYISVREFDKAIADLTKAAELIKSKPDSVEPDGAPNAQGIPTSTQHGNIWYHLALAQYLKADYEASLKSWEEAFRIATNDDTRIAVNDWRYMTLRRLKRDADAEKLLQTVNKDLKVIENTAYFKRMLMYKGELPVDSLLRQGETDALQYTTQGYGVGNWYLAKGDSAKAREIFTNVVNGGYWGAFGFIAAETDLSRWPK
jgi:tetratricopeptide (TPR) repeat protein